MTMFIPIRTPTSYLSTPHDLHVDKDNHSVLVKSDCVTYKGKMVEKASEEKEKVKEKISMLWRANPRVVGRSQFYFDRVAATITHDRSWDTWTAGDRSQFDNDYRRIVYGPPLPSKINSPIRII